MSNMRRYSDLTVWEAIKKATKEEAGMITKEQEEKIDKIKRPNFENIDPAK